MKIAAIDLGSNSFHLIVAQVYPNASFETLASEKEVLRLADSVAVEQRINPLTVQQAISTMTRFRSIADSLGVEEITAVATSAMREASNSQNVVSMIKDVTGIDVKVISGDEEARLIFLAIRKGVSIGSKPALALDIGGGSLEFMVGTQSSLSWVRSLKLGAARLSKEFITSDPISKKDIERLKDKINRTIDPVEKTIASFSPTQLIGSSGTLTALVKAASSGNFLSSPSSNQLSASKEELFTLGEKLIKSSLSQREKIPGIDSRRAEIIVPGWLVLESVMERFGFEKLMISEWALREGLLLEAILRHDPLDWGQEPKALRRHSVISLAERFDFDKSHSFQVASLALQLFDITQELHGLKSYLRELLEYGAMLHDIGERVSKKDHHKHSAYLILNGNLRGFSPQEIAILASLARFHHNKKPKASFEPFGQLDPNCRSQVVTLISLLRIADALDASRSSSISNIKSRISPNVLELILKANNEIDLEIWALRTKRELFEEIFSIRIEPIVELYGLPT